MSFCGCAYWLKVEDSAITDALSPSRRVPVTDRQGPSLSGNR